MQSLLFWVSCLLYISPISAFTRFYQCQAFHGGYRVSILNFNARENKETTIVFIWWTFPPNLPDLWSHVIHPSVTGTQRNAYLYWVLGDNVIGLVYFPTGFSSWLCTSQKSGKGWKALHLYCKFERLLLKIIAYGQVQTKRFTLFYDRLIHLSLRILFLSLMFYIFASSNQIWTMKYIVM